MDVIHAGSLIELLRIRANEQAEQTAYTFLIDGERQSVHISYAGLDQQARAIAARLQLLNLQGTRAMLLFPQGLDYISAFFGCLYAGVIAVPAYPPRNKRHLPRLQSIITNSQTSTILSTKALEHTLDEVFDESTDHRLPVLYTDGLTSDADAWRPPKFNPNDLAFLQYTSGSTGHAKGVMVTHANLMANQRLIKHGFSHDYSSTVVGWLPLYHDMGLIGNVMQPLFIGSPAILMSPMAFLEKPVRWLQAISQYRAHTSGGPNFAFDLCTQKISDSEKSQLDLSSWKLAFNGAEPIHASTLERFSRAFACCGFEQNAFYPCYGLAEATLLATGGTKSNIPTVKTFDRELLDLGIANTATAETGATRTLVGCGTAGTDHKVRIVDADKQNLCGDGRIGEIQVCGPSVTLGYWQNGDETTKTFFNDSDNRTWLKTGDLGFIEDGELFVSGRIKDLIIIRGRNYYPHDIEIAAEESVDCLNSGGLAAFALTVDSQEILILLAELKRSHLKRSDFSAEFAAIRKQLVDECGIQIDTLVFVKPGSILKTTSGKIRRNDCRTAFKNHHLDVIAIDELTQKTSVNRQARPAQPRFDLEQDSLRQELLLAPQASAIKLLANYLSKKIQLLSGLSQAHVDMSTPVLGLGIDSLKAMELKYTIDNLLSIELPIAFLLDDKSTIEIAEFAIGLIDDKSFSPSHSYQNLEKPSNHCLSLGQQAVWTICQLESSTVVYNLPVALRISSKINEEILRDALRILVNRHEQLRTGYQFDNHLPKSILLPQTDQEFSRITCSDEQDRAQKIVEEIDRPFDLEQDHKIRTCLFSISEGNHILVFCAHHIAVDFRSLVILLTELKTIYAAQSNGLRADLPILTSHYSDYSKWQQNYLNSHTAEADLNYWQRQLIGELPKLQLPFDHKRPLQPSYRGGSETLTIDADTTGKIRRMAKQNGVTLYMLLLTLFKVLLYRYSGQQDLIVGSPMLGRPKKEFAEVVGYFVNPVAIRSYPSGDKTFIDYLLEVKQTVFGALQHQYYPLSVLVEKLQPERGSGVSPFYDVCFVLQGDGTGDSDVAATALGIPDLTLNWPNLDVKTVNLAETIAQFDINLMMAVSETGLSAAFQYSCDLFDQSTISRMAGHFQTLLQGVLENPLQSLSSLPLLTEAERYRQLIEWNATASAYLQHDCIPQLFEQQVQRTPEAIALAYEDQSLSYDQLNRKANRLAHQLIKLGIHPDDRVAICVERSLEMVIGVLGILKAGAAYVPLDPSYPEERLAYMLTDCAPVAILIHQSLLDRIFNRELVTAPIILLDTQGHSNIEKPEEPHEVYYDSNPIPFSLNNQRLAYVIYTSGSTGQPKGVMVTHANVTRLFAATNEQFKFNATDCWTLFHSFAFDFSVWELWGALLYGGRLVVVPYTTSRNPDAFFQLVCREQVTVLNQTPSAFRQLVAAQTQNPCKHGLRYIIFGGEALEFQSLTPWLELNEPDRTKLINMYGITETTVHVTYRLLTRQDIETGLASNIGKPISDLQMYILDEYGHPVPIGVSGEIYIGGDGVARGYLNRPELTNERFINNPFRDLDNQVGHLVSARLYKTGDTGRWMEDGSVEYLGRNDFQVKIRGFRIELGEIESRLLQHPAIKEAAVLVIDDKTNDKYLVAYVVNHADDQPNIGSLKTFLKEVLPDYMIPAAFVFLEALPLTVNGKLDRKSLTTQGTQGRQHNEYIAPRDEVEEAIAAIWQQILGIEKIGIHDDFFDLGGHSLSAVQIITTLKKNYAIEVPVRTLFDAPTIAEFVDRIADYQED